MLGVQNEAYVDSPHDQRVDILNIVKYIPVENQLAEIGSDRVRLQGLSADLNSVVGDVPPVAYRGTVHSDQSGRDCGLMVALALRLHDARERADGTHDFHRMSSFRYLLKYSFETVGQSS